MEIAVDVVSLFCYKRGMDGGYSFKRPTEESFSLPHQWDLVGPICMLGLLFLGISSIHSAQLHAHGTQWRSQIFWGICGAIAYVMIARRDYRFFLRNAHWFYLFGILCLLLLFTPLGVSRYGAVRWLGVGGIRFQPSEVAKFTTLVMLAAALTGEKIQTVKESSRVLLRVFILFAIPWMLIFLQPDLGSALTLPPILLAMLYQSNLSSRFFTTVFAIAVVFLAIITWDIFRYRNFLDENGLTPSATQNAYQVHSWVPLKDYQRNRIIGFIAPEVVDPQGTGISWNLRQSLISIGSGGFWGKGSGKGMQAQLGYLPKSVSTNDFVFSVLAEEKGFVGAFFALTLLILLVINDLWIAELAHDRFGKYLALGIAIFFLMHVVVNIGMTLGMMPITGLPLPFLSYGGSFLLVCCVLQAIVQSIYHRRKNLH